MPRFSLLTTTPLLKTHTTYAYYVLHLPCNILYMYWRYYVTLYIYQLLCSVFVSILLPAIRRKGTILADNLVVLRNACHTKRSYMIICTYYKR